MTGDVKGPALEPVSPPMSGAGPSLVRHVNEIALLQVLRHHGPLSAPELASRVATSRPTVDAVLRSLVDQGWVTEQPGVPGSGRGRPARVYSFDATRHAVAALDLGSRTTRAVVTDLNGHRIGEAAAPAEPGDTPALVAERAAAVLARACRPAAVDPDDLAAVVAGAPGIVRPDGAEVVAAEATHRGLRADALPGGASTRRLLVNDVNLAALAELEHHPAEAGDGLFYLLLGDRMGTGLVLGGAIHQGVHGAAGEIGTLALLGWPEVHSDLLALASRRGQEVGAALDDLVLDAEDPVSASLLDRLLESLARGIAATVLVVDPGLVVVAGPAAEGDRFVALLGDALRRQTSVPINVRAAVRRDDQVCSGGIRTALTVADRSLFGSPAVPIEVPAVLA